MAANGMYYDPETIELLKTALDEAWSALSPEHQQTTLKTELAERILAAAASGERDIERLRQRALRPPMDSLSASQCEPAMDTLRSALTRDNQR